MFVALGSPSRRPPMASSGWELCPQIPKTAPVADPENFGGGGFEAKTSKIRMSSPKLRVVFRPKTELQTSFSPKIRWSPKKKKKKGLHQN